eukprot:759972_1
MSSNIVSIATAIYYSFHYDMVSGIACIAFGLLTFIWLCHNRSGGSARSNSGGSSANNNRSNQMNPNNQSYWQSHGWGSRPNNYRSHAPQSGNNRANQMNPNYSKSGNSKSNKKCVWFRNLKKVILFVGTIAIIIIIMRFCKK